MAAAFALGTVALCSVVAATDTQINVVTTNDQDRPRMVQLVNSNLVIVWTDRSGTNADVYYRTFTTNGAPLSGAQRANTFTNDDQRDAAIAALAGGGFAIAFSSRTFDGSGYAAAVRRYDSAGVPLDGADVQANTTTNGSQFKPRIAGLTNGGFVVAFLGNSTTNQDVYYRRFAANGTALDASDVRANGLGTNGHTVGDQGGQAVAALADGGFVIAYEDRPSGTIYGVRLDRDGNALDAPGRPIGEKQFALFAPASYPRVDPAAAGLTNGGWVATCTAQTTPTPAGQCVVGRVFSAAGVGGPEFQIGSHTSRWRNGGVAGLRDGDFVATWQATGQGSDSASDWSVFAQRINAAGVAHNEPFMVNVFNSDDQDAPVPAPVISGYAAVWESFDQDGSGWGVFSECFFPPTVPVAAIAIGLAPSNRPPVDIAFNSQSGKPYTVEASTNLTDWIVLFVTNPPTTTFHLAEYPPPAIPKRFYRILPYW